MKLGVSDMVRWTVNRGGNMRRLVLAVGMVVGLALNQGQVLAGPLPPGVTIYATELTNGGGEIVSVTGSTITPIVSVPGPDSLIFANGGIAFTNVFAGEVSFYNKTTPGGTTTVLATGLSIPQDIALIPAGFNADAGKVLVSDTGNGRIITQSLSGGAFTTFATPGNPTGLTFDPANHLFVLNSATLLEYNGAGTVIGSKTLPHGGDGLTYDPFTGDLFASYVGGIMEIPTSLASVTDIPYNGDRIDGIESDGTGRLFMADTATSNIVEYDIVPSTFTQETNVPTIDDLAPIVGSGSNTPEPATMTLLGLGAAGMLGYGWRKRKLARRQ
jgi:PEP-CTERM motif